MQLASLPSARYQRRLRRAPLPLPALALLSALCIGLLALPSCSSSADYGDDPSAFMPSDPNLLFRLDLPELYATTEWDAIRTHETWKSLSNGPSAMDAVMDLLFGPGVNRSKPALIFQEGADPLRAFVGLTDAAAFEAQLSEAGLKDVQSADGLRAVRAAGGWLCWTDALLAYYGSPDLEPASMSRVFAASAAESADASNAPNPDMEAFLAMPGMLHAWMQEDNWEADIPLLNNLTDGLGAARIGMRMTSETGLAGLHVAIGGLDAERSAQIQSWFLNAGQSRPWEQIPAGTPAWLSMNALPEGEGNSDRPVFMGDLGATTSTITAAFHQIKITRRGFIPRVSIWADAPPSSTAAAMETRMRDMGILESGQRLQLGSMDAEYAVGPNRIVASTTDAPATLLVMPREAVALPEAWAEAMAASPLRLYVDAQGLAKVLPLPDAATTLRDLTLYLEPRPGSGPDETGGLEAHLQIRSADPEASGADVALKATMELIPAIQTMAAFQ